MNVEMAKRRAERLKRYCHWSKICREVKRYINEGNDYFTVEIGGFEVKFDMTKNQEVKDRQES